MKVLKCTCLFLVYVSLIGCGGGSVKTESLIDQVDHESVEVVLKRTTPKIWAGTVLTLPEIEAANPDSKPEEIGAILWKNICQPKVTSSRGIYGDLYEYLLSDYFTDADRKLLAEVSKPVFFATLYATAKAYIATGSVFRDNLPSY